jgi:hypothetical protein
LVALLLVLVVLTDALILVVPEEVLDDMEREYLIILRVERRQVWP